MQDYVMCDSAISARRDAGWEYVRTLNCVFLAMNYLVLWLFNFSRYFFLIRVCYVTNLKANSASVVGSSRNHSYSGRKAAPCM